MTSPKHPADAYTIAIDPQAKHKGTLRIVRRFFMAEVVAVVTVHFDYQGKTYSETIRVADLDFPEAPEPAPERRAIALDALRAKAAASVTPRRPAMVAQPVQQAQAQHTPEPAPVSILDTPASFKPGTVVVLRRTGSTATVLHPLGDGKRKVRVELYNGEVAYFRPHQLQRDWSAPTVAPLPANVPDIQVLRAPGLRAAECCRRVADAHRLEHVLDNLQAVAASKREPLDVPPVFHAFARVVADHERNRAISRIAHKLRDAAKAQRLDPLRNVVAPIEPPEPPPIPVGERAARFKAYHEERDALGRALEVEDDGRPKPKRKPVLHLHRRAIIRKRGLDEGQ